MPATYTWDKRAKDHFRTWLQDPFGCVRRYVSEHIYQIAHLAWLVLVPVISSGLMYIQRPSGDTLDYTDALFLSVSAVCNVGLNTVNLGPWSRRRQGILFVQMILGDPGYFHSIIPLIKLIRVLKEKKRRSKPGCDDFCLDERALKILILHQIFLPLIWQSLAFIALLAHVQTTDAAHTIRTRNHTYLDPTLWCAFNVASSWSNTGYDLLNESMIPFQKDKFIIMNSAFLVMGGKTFAPVTMYVQLWLHWRLCTPGSKNWRALEAILIHPRFYHPNIFPKVATMWLAGAQTGYNLIAYAFWWLTQINGQPGLRKIAPDMSKPDLSKLDSSKPLTKSQFAAAGLVQCVMLRAGGMAIVAINTLPAVLVILFAFTMLWSMYPFVRVVSNFEDREERKRSEQQDIGHMRLTSYNAEVRRHFWKNFARFDSFFVLAMIGIIAWTETYEDTTKVWALIFEVISAFTNNGLSLGADGEFYSFCGSWKPRSKFLLMLVMLKGRHRKIPRTIDTDMHLRDWKLLEELLPAVEDEGEISGDDESPDPTELKDLGSRGRKALSIRRKIG